ncbi:MAG: pitrilysin family protein [Candidatus Zixiibacteriota bacterium]
MRRVALLLCIILLFGSTVFSADWHREVLDNGLKVMILENHQVPQANISTTIKVGAKNESDYFDGATHLLEHLILFRGTDNMTGEEVADAMKQHGAYFNGYTSSDWTDFVISLPKENLDFALQIHADMLFRSNFPKDEMDKERSAVVEEINISQDNPTATMYRSSLKTLYGEHPYSKNVLGTKDNVRNVPRDSVYAYYKRYYAPNNMTMVIVGDVNTQETMALVKKYFGGFPQGEVATDRYKTPPVPDKIAEIEIKKDIAQAYMMMSTIGPKADSPDQFPLDLMAQIIGGGESSRLWKKLKDELGIVYSTSFSFYTNKYEGLMFSFAMLDPGKIAEAERAINDVLNEVKQNGFTEQELRKAKNVLKTNHYRGNERGLDYADNIAQKDSYIGYEFVENYPDNIEQVTLAQLNETANKYLNTETYVKTMVVPQ